jgi:hypothetical protein
MADSSRSDISAKSFYERLHNQIREVEVSLKAGESVVLTHASASGVCVVEEVGFLGLDLIVFYGRHLKGALPCRLLVHMHAVNLTVTTVRGDKRQPISFAGELGKDAEKS